MRCSKCRSHGHNRARSKSCLLYKSTIEEKPVEEAVRQYGESASTGIFTRKNYLDSSIRSVGIPASVKDAVKGYLTRCVEKARIINYLSWHSSCRSFKVQKIDCQSASFLWKTAGTIQ